ncbi:hypothetical protein VNO77_26728 [Canavalia gladiata]|uniref:Uncharacterized protein n=1 Tax=Canavalia gladiata TaxID=3824 RepID=A0AAN9KVW4_CANGL
MRAFSCFTLVYNLARLWSPQVEHNLLTKPQPKAQGLVIMQLLACGISSTRGKDEQNRWQSALGHSTKYIEVHEQKNHFVALTLLDVSGVSLLLSLPTNSLFPGFVSVATSIVHHILEDPHIFQKVIQSEIKHSLVVAPNKHLKWKGHLYFRLLK